MGREEYLDRTRIVAGSRPQYLHELEHPSRVPPRAPHNLNADAVRFPLVVAAEFHHVAAGQDLSAGLCRARAAGVAQHRAEQPEQPVGYRALRYLIGGMTLR